MAMYFYASKISAIACGTRCRQTVLQKSRGQRDRDKCRQHHHRRHHRRRCQISSGSSSDSESADDCFPESDQMAGGLETDPEGGPGVHPLPTDGGIFSLDPGHLAAESALLGSGGIRYRRRHSAEQLSAHDLEMGFQQIELGTIKSVGSRKDDTVQYDVPKNPHKRSQCDINFESSVLGSGGILYINGKVVSGPLDSLIESLLPKNAIDLDKEFVFSFLLTSRLFLRPHELLAKLLDSVPESECLESLVALLSEWATKFPYDYRDERMMSHVKHIVARCSNSHLEAVVSQTLSALLKRLTDLERHEADLRACQTNDKSVGDTPLNCPTATQYAQIVCRLEKKLAKHIGGEEFLQCSSMILLDKQKKWDQPSSSGGPPGAQDPKKTCNLETYLDWSARLRLFVCNEILQSGGIEQRSRTVELWSGVAQYCLLVGNYNSATAILESLESPAIARLKITWSKLQVTCQQLDCMQRHAEGHGHLWQKQAIVLNEHQEGLKTDKQAKGRPGPLEGGQAEAGVAVPATKATGASASDEKPSTSGRIVGVAEPVASIEMASIPATSGNNAGEATTASGTPVAAATSNAATAAISATPLAASGKPNDWVVIPVFADIVKLALGERENCLQRLANGHINMAAFDRMAAIVGAFTKHMQAVKAAQAPSTGEYERFCWHMQQTTKLGEAELMMASFDCEEPNNAEKLMYDLN
ncbi:ras-GEF domain-containing family member 1B-B isoform X2 [Drosophila bipectinata]|uniref:ras-GEF domain-containing family member 1B-B isoform X2 n=1 Tax=Drosophila bipectinata TaxID=42026 RepID=UPI0038B2D43E